ncbi:hypothetical protein [Nostoc sp.]|uniref:hypothetical protein n=1 Tax=Nostoc sp. TaxID=1180 RepID=UPI002FFBCFC3
MVGDATLGCCSVGHDIFDFSDILLEAVKLPANNLIAFITDPTSAQSYPIVTYTWLLTYHQYPNRVKAQVLKTLLIGL